VRKLYLFDDGIGTPVSSSKKERKKVLEINLGRLRDTPSICEAIIPR
jgi:hypothetical protein